MSESLYNGDFELSIKFSFKWVALVHMAAGNAVRMHRSQFLRSAALCT